MKYLISQFVNLVRKHTAKKLAPVFLVMILFVGIGTFVVPKETQAQFYPTANGQPNGPINPNRNPVTGLPASGSTEAPPECSLFSPKTWFNGCLLGAIGALFWQLLIPISGYVLWLIGQLIDIAVNLSFSTGGGLNLFDSTAIRTSWSVIRDLCNMLFIFVLIYAGISTILNLSNINLKKTVMNVIIAALFINFSLFITHSIIDVSNITAAWFIQGVKNIGGSDSISDSVRASLQMTKLAESKEGGGALTRGAFFSGVALFAVNCVAIYVFFNVAFLFLARIVVLMFLLITSPIGFMTWLGVGDLSKLGADWWKELRNSAIMAPMFFLMLYVTMYIVDNLNEFVFAGAGQGDPIGESRFSPANYVLFVIIIMMLLKCKEMAVEYSGKMGNQLAGYMKSAAALTVGAAAGGAALIGRAGASAAFAKAAEGQTVGEARRKAFATTIRAATPIWNSTTSIKDKAKAALKDGSYDVRNVPGLGSIDKEANKLGGLVGIKMDAKSAKDQKAELEAKKKEFKVEEHSDKLLEQIRDIETAKLNLAKAKTDFAAGTITKAQYDTEQATYDSKIKTTKEDMSKTASKLSNNDLEKVDKGVIRSEEFIQSMSQSQVEHLTGKADAPDEVKAGIWKSRLADVTGSISAAKAPGAVSDVKKTVKAHSADELANLSVKDLTDPEFVSAENMDYSKFSDLLKKKNLTSSTVKAMKDARYQNFFTALRKTPPDYAAIGSEIADYDPVEIAKLGWDEDVGGGKRRLILGDENIIFNLDSKALAKMYDELNTAQLADIRRMIENMVEVVSVPGKKDTYRFKTGIPPKDPKIARNLLKNAEWLNTNNIGKEF